MISTSYPENPLRSASLTIVDQLLEESLAYTRSLIEDLTPAGLRTGELISALDLLALEMRQQGYQVHVATVPSSIRLARSDNHLSLPTRS